MPPIQNKPPQHSPTDYNNQGIDLDGDGIADVESEEGGEQTNPQIPKGSNNQLKSIPANQRAAILQMVQMYGYAEYSFGGQTFWFTAQQVFSAFGVPAGSQSQMSQYGGAPPPGYQGSNTRMAMSGPGGGGQQQYMNMGGPGGYGYGGGYGGYGMGGYGGYGSGPLYNTMFGGIQQDEMYAQRRQIRKTEQQMRYKMRMIMFMILCGDVTGAMRAMIFESERMNRMFNRTLVKQLNRVREAKAKILKAMGSKRPPTAHSNVNNPDGAARDQNRQAKYTQWVSVTTQLMSEVQQTERELLDLLSEGRRNINELWEAYSGLKEAEGRTTRTLIQSFRG